MTERDTRVRSARMEEYRDRYPWAFIRPDGELDMPVGHIAGVAAGSDFIRQVFFDSRDRQWMVLIPCTYAEQDQCHYPFVFAFYDDPSVGLIGPDVLEPSVCLGSRHMVECTMEDGCGVVHRIIGDGDVVSWLAAVIEGDNMRRRRADQE